MDPLLAVTPEGRVDRGDLGARCTLIHRMMPHRLILHPGDATRTRRVLAGSRRRDSGRVPAVRRRHCIAMAADSSTAPFCRLRPSADPRTWNKDAVGQAVDPHVFRFTTFLHSFRRGTSGLVQRPSDSLLLANSSEHGYRLLSTQHNPHHTPEHPIHHSFYPCSSFHNSPRLIHCHPGETMNDAA